MRMMATVCLISVALAGAVGAVEWQGSGPYLGTVNDLAVDPRAPDTVYASTTGGAVWRSSDGGRTWALASTKTARGLAWMVVDPSDSNVLWGAYSASGEDAGLLRSVDRGATWQRVREGYTGVLGRMAFIGQPIAFSPVAPKQILVPATNLHYRSEDGGKTWTDFRVAEQDAYVFAWHPTDPKVVYAGGRGQERHVARSTDAGKTWVSIGEGLGERSITTLKIDPAAPDTLYALAGTFHQVFKSADAGKTWVALDPGVGGTDDIYELLVVPVEGQASVLWVGTKRGLRRSTDGGATWQRMDRGTSGYLPKALVADPRDPQKLLVGTAGTAVYRSEDGGSTWQPSSTGLAAAWIERFYGRRGAEGVFAQASVGLFRWTPGGWVEVVEPFADAGDEAEPDGLLPDRATAGAWRAFDGSQLWTSTNHGASWVEVEQKQPSMREMMRSTTSSAQFASLVQDPRDPKVLYAGAWSNRDAGHAVYKTSDGGKKWVPAGTGLPTEHVTFLAGEAPGTVFAVIEGRRVFRTTDGGGSWTAAGSGLPDEKIRCLEVDPTDPSRVFVATDKGFFRSTDAGGSWSAVAGGVEKEDVEAVTVDPASGRVWIGTFNGLFVSDDGGSSWREDHEGLPLRDIRALAVAGQPARLWVGFAGGSVVSRPLE